MAEAERLPPQLSHRPFLVEVAASSASVQPRTAEGSNPATPETPGRAKQRFLKRFKKRAPASNIWPSPIVLKVGTSECGSIRSAAMAGTDSSWQLTGTSISTADLEALASQYSSITGRTLRYEDLEAALSGQQSVVTLEEIVSELHKSVVTVDSPRSTSASELNQEITRITIDYDDIESLKSSEVGVSDRNSDPTTPNRPNIREAECQTAPDVPLTDPQGPLPNSPEGQPLHPGQFLRVAGPHGHPIFLPPLSPHGSFWIPPRFVGAATPPIELTRWRLNPNFDPNPGLLSDGNPRECRGEARRTNRAPMRGPRDIGNLLAPEDLPRIFPTPMMPPHFSRLEDDMCDGDSTKGCCGPKMSHTTMMRVFIAVISMVGLACVIVGIALGALTVSGSTRLTLCLLMIGVGVVLITVSGIAWRLTSLDITMGTSCWTILGLRSQQPHLRDRRSRTGYFRVRSPHGRFMHPFSGMMHPEFSWRPPPPSYHASVRDENLQQLQEMQETGIRPPVGSPPPTYRATPPEPRTAMDIPHDPSRPPSYRSHESLPNILIEEVTLPNPEHFQQSTFVTTTSAQACSSSSNQASPVVVQASQPSPSYISRAVNSDRVPLSAAQSAETVTVIDCSTAVPVEFQMPDSHSSLQRPYNARRKRKAPTEPVNPERRNPQESLAESTEFTYV